MQTANQKIENIIIDLKAERLKEIEMFRIKQMSLKIIENVIVQHGEEQTAQLATMGAQMRHEGVSEQGQQQRSCLLQQRSCRRSCCRHRQRIIQSQQQSQEFQQKIIHWKKWTKTQQKLFCKFIGTHGSDFTLLQSLFPNKTRKQLKKKYQQVHKSKKWVQQIDSIERCVFRQKRKSHFDHFISQVSSSDQLTKCSFS